MRTVRLRAALAGTALGAAVALAVVAPASAHNVLLQTVPANASTVRATPSKVTLIFDRPALAIGTALVVTGPKGQVQDGKAVLVDNDVTQSVDPGAPAGAYTVEWRVTSADGHPIEGTFAFTSTRAGSGHASVTTTPSASPAADAGTGTKPKGPVSRLTGALIILVAAIAGVRGSKMLRNRKR